MADIIMIQHERILIKIFQYLLSKGIVKGVTRNQYYSILGETMKKINSNISGCNTKVMIEEDITFEKIVERANILCSFKKDGISIKPYKDQFIAMPTYSFMDRTRPNENILYLYPRMEEIFHLVIDSTIKPRNVKGIGIKVTPEQLDIAKKVAARYVNELMQKYVKKEIEKGNWPKQCADIDEYIFKRNIAQYIDEPGTAECFKRLYLKAIETVCVLIKENKGTFKISNNEDNMLDYANYLRILNEEEFQFLVPLKYNKYEKQNKLINCTVTKKDAMCYSRELIYSDPFDDDDEYASNVDSISEKEVEIMEERIGKIVQK